MGIARITQYATHIDADIQVDVRATALLLHAGRVRVRDVVYELAATEVPLTTFNHACTVRVFLVVRKGTQLLSVLVDECEHDGIDRPYSFADSPFESLHVLAVGVLPAKCEDATQGEWHIYQIGSPPAEPRSAPPAHLPGKRDLS